MAAPSYLGLLFLVAFLAFIVVIVAVSVSAARRPGGSQKDNPNLRPCSLSQHSALFRASSRHQDCMAVGHSLRYGVD